MNWQAPPDQNMAKVVWHRTIRPEGCFVREEAFGQVIEYGPMPEEAMLPLIAERKAYFEAAVDRMISETTAKPLTDIDC